MVDWGGVEPMVRFSRLTSKEIPPRMLGRVHMGTRLIPIGRRLLAPSLSLPF